MKFSTKAEYGLRAIIHLAKSKEQLSLASIAQKEHLSLAYLERIFAILKKQHFVISHKGTKGGYQLARSANKITVGEIIEALEGNLYDSKCCVCSVSGCQTKPVWDKLNKEINKTLHSITLFSLIK